MGYVICIQLHYKAKLQTILLILLISTKDQTSVLQMEWFLHRLRWLPVHEAHAHATYLQLLRGEDDLFTPIPITVSAAFEGSRGNSYGAREFSVDPWC